MKYQGRMRCVRALVLSALVGIGASGNDALARPIPWKSNHFAYVADHKDVKEVLRDLGASEGVMTWISPQVEGVVTGRFDETPQRFLDRMADSFGFIWYYDGSVLRVSGPNEARSQTIGLVHATTDDLRAALSRLGVNDPRFPVLYDDKTRTAVVSGPPRMVELAADVAHLIDRDVERGDTPEVRSFKLHYAWATDRSLMINGEPVVVPGVVTVLRSLYSNDADPRVGNVSARIGADAYRLRSIGGSSEGQGAGANGRLFPPLPGFLGGSGPSQPAPTSGQDTQRNASTPPLPDDMMSASAGSPSAAGPASTHPDAPIIRADARDNAVLVRARAEAMPALEHLITSLDRRPGVLEIDASIIEISETGLKELGVDWRLNSSHIDIETGNGQNAQASFPGSINPQGFPNSNTNTSSTLSGVAGTAAAMTPAGGVLTAVIGGTGRYLLSRISALEQTDNARITANPKVTTLDNVEAVMDNKQTFYVPVQGFESGSLYSVSAGVALRVLPSIVSEQGKPQIRLDVHIEDGQLTGQNVGQLPVVSKSTIDTQTLIDQGQSLLIAGYTVDQDDHSESGVPVLSKIPLIGGLFKFKHHQGQKFQRLFLLTPRVVSAAAATDDASACCGQDSTM
ncbi:MAG TPA: type III secretion system outer membrane ring subunit SctC [Trinickia sp.]|uniref:type III secretion system outer membrane ring subunit SctC n=1 Tax=Trinickia sp. TaxID=2571163 RepID=UPI002CA1AF11|nr:type III secretion system outer membrane ring subunit SctC [Trinickia sp.]HVW50459.1 type III secretion system outer membrane ring subunit SctC [Trinickia sp.]